MMKEAMNHNYNFVTSGGYKNIEDFGSVNNLNTSILHSTHEEADMRIIVHYYLQWARDIKNVLLSVQTQMFWYFYITLKHNWQRYWEKISLESIYKTHSDLLNDVGENVELLEKVFHNLQNFTMRLYS